jgi:hypothetical protein
LKEKGQNTRKRDKRSCKKHAFHKYTKGGNAVALSPFAKGDQRGIGISSLAQSVLKIPRFTKLNDFNYLSY